MEDPRTAGHRKGVEAVRRRIAAVVQREPARVELTVANHGRRATPVLRLHDPVSGTQGASDLEVTIGNKSVVTTFVSGATMSNSGTAATFGRGRGIVTATGMQTEMGRIAGLLKGTPLETTPLQKELARVGRDVE